MAYHFAVVIRVGAYPGNHALADADVWIDEEFTANHQPICLTNSTEQDATLLWISLRVPVFTVGEILILDPDGRECSGRGRKPSKWDVTVEEFPTLETAIARAQAVLATVEN